MTPASASWAARLTSGTSVTSWPPRTRRSSGTRSAAARSGCSVTRPSGPGPPAGVGARAGGVGAGAAGRDEGQAGGDGRRDGAARADQPESGSFVGHVLLLEVWRECGGPVARRRGGGRRGATEWSAQRGDDRVGVALKGGRGRRVADVGARLRGVDEALQLRDG